MFRIAVFFLLLLAAWAPAQIVPDLFIVEMADAPKGSRQASISKQSVRSAAIQRGAQILDSFDRLLDALVVRIPEDQAGALSTLPGVRNVYRVMEGQLELDGALPLHRAYDAWSRIGGMDRAGDGIRIAIGSDGPSNPYLNIMLACDTATRGDEALTREEAVIAYTAGSAFAEFQDDKTHVLCGDY